LVLEFGYRMTSWGGNRQYAQAKKVQEGVSFFQTTEADFCSNANHFFLAYGTAVKNSSSLYVRDVPNMVGQTFSLFQSILKDNSTIKYLKEIPPNSTPMDAGKLSLQSLSPMNFQTMKRMARDLFFYNGDAQEKIMSRIRGAGLERTVFDVGLHIHSADTKFIPKYVDALRTFSRRLGKPKLSVFVMADTLSLYDELKSLSPPDWTFTTLASRSSPSPAPTDAFYDLLTDLHILQNTPNLVVSYSHCVGRFLYLTSRFQHTTDSILSLDVQQWSLP
jgi:hypothetical protein